KETVARGDEDKADRDEKQRPDDTDNAPGRFVVDDAVSNEYSHSRDGEIAEADLAEKQAKGGQNQSGADGPLIASDEKKPVVEGLFVAVAVVTSLKPGVERLVET